MGRMKGQYPKAGAHPLDQYLQGNLGCWGAHNEAGAKTQSLSETLGPNVKLFPEPRLFWSRGLSVGSADEWVCAQPAFLTSLVAQRLKRLPTMRETRVQSLGWEDPLEKGTVTLACKIPWTEEPGWLQSMGSQRVRHD